MADASTDNADDTLYTDEDISTAVDIFFQDFNCISNALNDHNYTATEPHLVAGLSLEKGVENITSVFNDHNVDLLCEELELPNEAELSTALKTNDHVINSSETSASENNEVSLDNLCEPAVISLNLTSEENGGVHDLAQDDTKMVLKNSNNVISGSETIASEVGLDPAVSTSNLSSEECGEVQDPTQEVTKGTRKRRCPSQWKKNYNKKLRMDGKAYMGYRRTKEGQVFHDQERPEKVMGAACQSPACEKSALRKCNTISEQQRKMIFHNYWNKMNWDQRRVYLSNMIVKQPVKRRTKKDIEEESRRKDTLRYHLTIDGVKEQVCQKMFLSTLGINKWTVRYWISKDCRESNSELETSGMSPHGGITRRSTRGKLKKCQANEYAKTFFRSLAKLPSHYCRKSSSLLYLEPIFQSMRQLYQIYIDKCKEENEQCESLILSLTSFTAIFKDTNLSLYLPKKDMCDFCCSYKAGNVNIEEYERHITHKDAARQQKEHDKEMAKNGECHTFTMDMQAVKLCPFLNASALYYKTKLNVHNFTMYNVATKRVICYWFDETCSRLEASTFASCVVDHLDQVLNEDLKAVVLWSDGCGYQNRNVVLANALLHLAVTRKVIIEQKFLIKGHTQMECDSVHSVIETKLKNKEIYLPSQYCSITKEARKCPFPYEAKYVPHTFFKDYSKKNTMVYDSIRPGRKPGDPTVSDIRALRYDPKGVIFIKLDFQSDYEELPRRPRSLTSILDFPRLNKDRLKIPERKWKDLQDLKFVLPDDCHLYYDSLPY